jgi:phosphatidylglycerophosphate synthase
MTQTDSEGRRPLKTRAASWAGVLSSYLARRRISPNVISTVGVVFALLGAVSMGYARFAESLSAEVFSLVVGAVFIQLRLLANMLDGMVAVEGGRGGPLGNLYNEFPDRIEDVVLIVSAGYAATASGWPFAEIIGWTACVLALLVAYVRALAAGIGGGHPFHGPMAKPHRMFLLTCGCLVAAATAPFGMAGQVLFVTLLAMILGMVITLIRRLGAVSRVLQDGWEG